MPLVMTRRGASLCDGKRLHQQASEATWGRGCHAEPTTYPMGWPEDSTSVWFSDISDRYFMVRRYLGGRARMEMITQNNVRRHKKKKTSTSVERALTGNERTVPSSRTQSRCRHT